MSDQVQIIEIGDRVEITLGKHIGKIGYLRATDPAIIVGLRGRDVAICQNSDKMDHLPGVAYSPTRATIRKRLRSTDTWQFRQRNSIHGHEPERQEA